MKNWRLGKILGKLDLGKPMAIGALCACVIASGVAAYTKADAKTPPSASLTASVTVAPVR